VGKGARKKGPKQASDRKPKVRDVFVGQPFEGLAAEPELIALREFVPSATAELTLADGGDVTLGTVLPMAAAAFVRSDGRRYLGLQVQTRSSDISRDLGTYGDVQIGTGETNPLVRGLHQDIGQNRESGLRWNAGCYRGETFLKLLPGNREPHHRSCGEVCACALLC